MKTTLLSTFFILAITPFVWGQIPQTMSYQGVLSDASDVPVPDGNYNVFSFVNVPYFAFLVSLWVLGTLIFTIPLVMGIFKFSRNKDKSKNYDVKNILLVWSFPYLILFIIYAAYGFAVSRRNGRAIFCFQLNLNPFCCQVFFTHRPRPP